MGMTVSEALKRSIEASGVSRYRISKETGVEESALSRFVNGRRSLDLRSVDEVATYLGLELVAKKQPGRAGKDR
jgi:transcriptional regulator with XRE-family HTH domain